MVLKTTPAPLIGSILVLCTQNAVRSPMLEAMLKHHFGNRIFIDSAGVESSAINPFAIEVMKEWNMDLAQLKSRAYDQLEPNSYDLVIALSRPACDLARKIAGDQVLETEFWSVPEPPVTTQGHREQILESYRKIRDELYLHMKNRFGIKNEASPPS